MEENIEVKDVQRTEYLDKNGLDMLWAKVKENTHNQVEVERNRAVAKEDSLSQEIANIKPATKESLGVVKVGDGLNVTDGTISVDSTAIGSGKYIPYESIAADDNINYKTYVMKHNEGILFDSASGDISIKDGEINLKRTERELSLTPSFIWLQEISDNGNRETLLFELNENGLRLRYGDNNHVLTSYGSTIDITKYALKSVYDKKIAALKARIAALEAKHAELLNEIKTNVKKDFNV